MKRFLFVTLVTLICSMAYSTSWIKTTICQNGTWYPWNESSFVGQYGTWDRFVVYHTDRDPSNFYFRITIENFSIPPKKVRKEHIKNNEWYQYKGYIEYWIDDDHMDFLSNLYVPNILLPMKSTPWNKYNGRPSIIKKTEAVIKIQPYEKTPVTYNIWFEGIGFAFYFFQSRF